jgi:hypothetical protein
MLLGTLDMSHPGWGSVSGMYHSAQLDLKQGITAIYVSHKNDPLDNTGFITGSDCPHTLNKWECAFLAPTNCSIPAIVTNCSVHECVQQVVPSTFYFSVVFDSGTLNATHYSANSKEFKQLLATNKHFIPMIRNETFSQALTEPDVKFSKPYSNKVKWVSKNNHANSFIRFMLRHSYFYRSTIHQVLHRFYQSNRFTPKADRCVAAHIRRGDRATSFGVQITNMT